MRREYHYSIGSVVCRQALTAILTVCGMSLPAMAQSGGELAIDEIVVTAQKRAQSVQDIGMSITAIPGADLDRFNVSEPKDLAGMIPGLFSKPTLGDANPIFTTRGIGLNDFVSNNNSPTSLYVDDVYKPFSPMAAFSLFDIQRVEVLKGPQGTLYGRNNTGGAVKFIQNRPTEEFEGTLKLDYGRFDLLEAEVALSGPLAEDMRGRVAVFTKQGGDWQNNPATGEKFGDANRLAGRAMLDWDASSALTVSLEFHGGYAKGSPQQLKLVNSQDPTNTSILCDAASSGALVFDGSCTDLRGYFETSDDIRHTSGDNSGAPNGAERDNYGWGGSLQLDWQLGGAVVTSITGYDKFRRREGIDADGTPFLLADGYYDDTIKAFSQELRIASDGPGDLKWIAGAYFSYDKIDLGQTLFSDDFLPLLTGIPAPIDAQQAFEQKTKAYAAFGNVEYAIDEKWSIIGGLRFSYEERDFAGGSTFITGALGNIPLASTDDRIDADDLSGQLALNFRANEDVLLYLQASRGFKSGGFNAAFASSPVDLLPFDREILWAYEAGWKATFLNGALRFNGAGYYYDWKDMQAQILLVDEVGIPNQVLSNAGDAEIYGFELDAVWSPTVELQFGLAMNLISAEVVSGQLEGLELANTPEFETSGYARYTSNLGSSDWTSFLQVDFSYRSKVNFRLASETGWSVQEGYALLNARVGVATPDENTHIDVWVRNITNKKYLADTFEQLPINVLHSWGAPRTFGISLRQGF